MKHGARDRARVRLGDVVARIAGSRGGILTLRARAVRPDQHAVAARFAHGFDDQPIQVVHDVRALLFVPQHIRLNVVQHGIFAEVETNQCRT